MSDDIILSDEDMQETLRAIKGESEELEQPETDVEEVEDEDEEDESEESKDKDDVSELGDDDNITEESDTEDGLDADIGEEDGKDKLEENDPDTVRPPSTWTAEAKSLWAKVDPRIRQEILKREEDIGRGISSYKQRAELGDRFQQVLTPYTPLVQASGYTPDQVVSSMLNTYYRLKSGSPQEKAQMLLSAAQEYGADMSVFKQDIDPQQQQLNQQLNPFMQRVQQLEQQLQSQNQQSEQMKMAEATSQIESFRNALDETGSPKYPYFDNVRVKMGSLIEARNEEINFQNSTNGFSNLKPMSLEEAYDEAIWANPETRSLLTATQSQAEEEKRKQEAKKKTAEAKKIDKTNIKSKPSRNSKQAKPIGELEDTMRDVLKDIKSRAD